MNIKPLFHEKLEQWKTVRYCVCLSMQLNPPPLIPIKSSTCFSLPPHHQMCHLQQSPFLYYIYSICLVAPEFNNKCNNEVDWIQTPPVCTALAAYLSLCMPSGLGLWRPHPPQLARNSNSLMELQSW